MTIKWWMRKAFLLALTVVCIAFKAGPVPEKKTLTFDLAVQSGTIRNIFSDINLWDFREDWLGAGDAYPADYFARNYPFVKRIQLMTATGGNHARDLFVDPTDTGTMTDYRFDVLVAAIRNVVKQGLKPMIKTGNVPMKFTREPKIGGFGVNVRPPDSYEVYYDYIRALAKALVAEFGLETVRGWSWGVLTEYENKDWFVTEDDSPETSLIAYCKLYDFTVAALEDVIGAEQLIVGAHSMTVSEGLWDERKFIEHVAKGTNHKTGKKGTQVDFLCASFYDKSPGVALPGNLTLSRSLSHLQEHARTNGLTDLAFGIDEGRLLYGPEADGRDLWTRVVGHSFQGAADARMFRTMADLDADWFASWGLTTERLWGGVPTVATHVAGLGYRMAGNRRVALSGEAGDAAGEVGGMGGFSEETGKAHFMVYNYQQDLNARTVEKPEIVIKNIVPGKGKTVRVRQWIIDDAHANFWPAWYADMQAKGIGNDAFSWSKYSVDVPRNMKKQADKDFWYSKEASYKALATLESTETTMRIKGNTLVLNPILNPHAVVFYEVSEVRAGK